MKDYDLKATKMSPVSPLRIRHVKEILSSKKILISLFLLLFFSIAIVLYLWKTTSIIEIISKKDGRSISFTWADIETVGIEGKIHYYKIIFSFVPEKSATLEKFTRANIREKVIIKTASDVLSEGIIIEPIINSSFVIDVGSEDEALDIIKRIGMDKPDYYLKPTAEEFETAKHLNKLSDNPWSQKLLNALRYENYNEAAKYTIKAIESDSTEPYFYGQLGYIYYKQNKKKMALEQYLKATSLIKKEDICKYSGFYSAVGNLYSDYENYPKAISTYKLLISSNCWSQYRDRIEIAKIYEKKGNTDLALKEYTLLSKSNDKKIAEIGLAGIEKLTNSKKK